MKIGIYLGFASGFTTFFRFLFMIHWSKNIPSKTLLDNAPNDLVGCVIQKRICWIPGITDVLSNDNQDHKIKLLVENKQIALNREDEEQCNFDYKGEIILRKNNFGFLKTKVIRICLSINGALLSIPQFKSWWRFVFNEVNDWFHN